MTIPRFSIRSCLVAIGLVAVNLAVFRGWFVASRGGGATSADLLGLSVLPMLNVLMIAGAGTRRDSWSRSPFAKGFLVCGLVAVMVHAACHLFWFDAVLPLYSGPFIPFMQFCQAHIPYSDAPLPDGKSYFRYYPALGFVYCSPQFILAMIGGIFLALIARSRRRSGWPPDLMLERPSATRGGPVRANVGGPAR